jgi:hypothetical protein
MTDAFINTEAPLEQPLAGIAVRAIAGKITVHSCLKYIRD